MGREITRMWNKTGETWFFLGRIGIVWEWILNEV